MYNAALAEWLTHNLQAVDYVEVIPDTLWSDRGTGILDPEARFEEHGRQSEMLAWLASRASLVAHSVGLSIGSAELFDTVHVEQVSRWSKRFGFAWHSDHLSFNRVGESAHDRAVGMALPVPYDRSVLELIAFRVGDVMRRVPLPFLLENNVYYVDTPEQEMTEPEFLNELASRTGCGVLLDLHNVYTNSRNHGFDPSRFVEQLDPGIVHEIHIAGGEEMDGVYTDAHSGPCPAAVWDLLERHLPRLPRVQGVTFEVLDSAVPALGDSGLLAEVERARAIWKATRG